MKNKLLKKFRRYLELSIKFEESSEDIFGDIPMKSNNTSIVSNNWNFSTGTNISICCNQENTIGEIKVKTRAERIMDSAKESAKLADEYDEYKELQKSLNEFLTAEKQL